MKSKNIVLFCEDSGHETFISALVDRLARVHEVTVEVEVLSSTGGHGRMLSDLSAFVEDLQDIGGIPDLIIVARDSNCRGVTETQTEIVEELGEFADFALLAIPNPHVERWLLVDSAAFKEVFGAGCDAPDEKCSRGRYKRILAESIRDAAGINPSLGGIEYADDIVSYLDLDRMITKDDSLGGFIQNLRRQFEQWK